jgi:invasion protein IalB
MFDSDLIYTEIPMSKIVKVLAAVSMLAATPLMAQVGSLSDGSLMESKPSAPPRPPVPENVTSEIIGDWDLRCTTEGPDPKPCVLYQTLVDEENFPIIEVEVAKLPEGGTIAAQATFIAPLQTLLGTGLGIAVDGVLLQRVPFVFCHGGGCIARMNLSPIEVKALKEGTEGVAVIFHALSPDKPVNVRLSLNGMTKAYDKTNPVSQ